MEVDLETAIQQRLDVYASEIKRILREDRIRYRAIQVQEDGTLLIRFRDSETRPPVKATARAVSGRIYLPHGRHRAGQFCPVESGRGSRQRA